MHKSPTACSRLMSPTTWRSLAAYCSRDSNQGRLGVVACNFKRIQATAVSCKSMSAQQPGWALASSPQNKPQVVPISHWRPSSVSRTSPLAPLCQGFGFSFSAVWAVLIPRARVYRGPLGSSGRRGSAPPAGVCPLVTRLRPRVGGELLQPAAWAGGGQLK